MNQPESEADARIEIDELLRQADWDPADKSMVGTEIHAEDRDGSHSRADYVLYDQRGRPLAVIEAKKNAIDPYVAKQQALPYAQSLGAPFIFLANGELTYFWDYRNDGRAPDRRLLLPPRPGTARGDARDAQAARHRRDPRALHP